MAALRSMGLSDYADAVDRVLLLFPSSDAATPDERLGDVAERDDQGAESAELDRFEAVAYSHDKSLNGALARFVARHPADFPATEDER